MTRVKRKAGRPKLPTRIQITVNVEKETKRKLIREAIKQNPLRRAEIGRVIDSLVERYL